LIASPRGSERPGNVAHQLPEIDRPAREADRVSIAPWTGAATCRRDGSCGRSPRACCRWPPRSPRGAGVATAASPRPRTTAKGVHSSWTRRP
jgi:hypothetical protein